MYGKKIIGLGGINSNLEMMKLMNKSLTTMPGSQKQKKIIQKLNKLRIKNGLKPLSLKRFK